jgi:hypothetical protein
LTTYPPGDMKKKAQLYLDRNIKSLTNGQCKTKAEFIQSAVYLGFMSSEDDKKANWQQNIDNIEWAINRMADKYVNGAEYNAYKHGLRVMAGYAFFRMYFNENPNGGIHWASHDSLMFLELKDIGEGGLTVYQTTKQFNPQESMEHIFLMCCVFETIKSVRLARLKGEEGAKLNTFFNMNKEGLLQLRNTNSWSTAV